MGWIEIRYTRSGEPRYIAKYRDIRGRKQTAGTFRSSKKAEKAWQAAEVKASEGRVADPRRGRQRFARYVAESWLPHHVMEASTREGYTYQIYKHVMPWFGGMKMNEILPYDTREWITDLTKKKVKPATIENLRNILSAIFTTALNDEVIFLHPCKGVKTPTVAVKPPVIISPEQFDAIYEAIHDDDLRLLLETDIETGLRWGELTELRVKDLNFKSCILTVSRAVVQVNRKFHPNGERFIVKQYPKDGEYRRFKVNPAVVKKIETHVTEKGLGPDDLLFELRQDFEAQPRLSVAPNPATLGKTKPNEKGYSYDHGTLSAYSAGKCRCEHCRGAYALYRRERRASGKDSPRRPRVVDTDGHIPRDWFRMHVWKPTLEAAEIEVAVQTKHMRHAHASWLLHGGADIQVVKERMGHKKISTTERYLGTLPEVDETALDALDKIRNRGKSA
ncbi:MAG: tyrosine-type recombinase/integrase [Trebonia sp.]